MASVRFINCAERTTFNNKLTAGEIASSDIVFIADEKMIWTHEIFYPCPYTKDEIDELIKAGEFTSATIGELVVSNQLTLEGEEKLDVPRHAVVNVPTGIVNFISGDENNVMLLADISGNAHTATTAEQLSDSAMEEFVLVDGTNPMTGALVANGGIKLANNTSLQGAVTSGNYVNLIHVDYNDNIVIGDSDLNVIVSGNLGKTHNDEIDLYATQSWVADKGYLTQTLLSETLEQYVTNNSLTNTLSGYLPLTGGTVNGGWVNFKGHEDLENFEFFHAGINLIGNLAELNFTSESGITYGSFSSNDETMHISTDFKIVLYAQQGVYITDFSDRNKIATQGWVTDQGYLTSTNAASIYLTTTDAANTYLPLTGGTISGDLTVNNILTVGTLQLSSLSSISANTTGKIYITAASNTTLIVDGDNEQLTFMNKDVATVDKLTAVSTITSGNAVLGKHIYTAPFINMPAIAGEYELLIPSESGLLFSTTVKDVNGETVFNIGNQLLKAQGYLKVWVSGAETYIIDDSKFKYEDIVV